MERVEQDTITALTIAETSSGNLHIGHDDDERDSEYELGIIVERAAVPRLIRALKHFVLKSAPAAQEPQG
jgi:hypothetical protein